MDYDPPPVDPCSTLKAKLARLKMCYITRALAQAAPMPFNSKIR
jgi:hypothetical protein